MADAQQLRGLEQSLLLRPVVEATVDSEAQEVLVVDLQEQMEQASLDLEAVLAPIKMVLSLLRARVFKAETVAHQAAPLADIMVEGVVALQLTAVAGVATMVAAAVAQSQQLTNQVLAAQEMDLAYIWEVDKHRL